MNSNPIYPYCEYCYNFEYIKIIHFAGDCINETKRKQDHKCIKVDTDNKKRKHEDEPESNEFSKMRKS